MKTKSKYNCVFCLTPISKGVYDLQNGKCQRCQYSFPDAMPVQQICAKFGCTEYARIGKEFCNMHKPKPWEDPLPYYDTRYLKPKRHHGYSKEIIDKAIESNSIYSEVMSNLSDDGSKDALRDQVGYGMNKYPELLNPLSWSMVESLDHKIQEQVDALQYTVMHKQQLIKYLNDNKIEKAVKG